MLGFLLGFMFGGSIGLLLAAMLYGYGLAAPPRVPAPPGRARGGVVLPFRRGA